MTIASSSIPVYTGLVRPISLPRRAFALSSLAALVLVLALVWTMALRENRARRLDFEYEIYRISTNIAEEYFQDPASVRAGASVLGFGLYTARGAAIARQGTAPELYEARRPFSPGFSQVEGRPSIVFVRSLGAEDNAARMRGMMNGRGMQGMMRGMGRGGPPDAAPPAMPPAAPEAGPQAPSMLGQPRILWLEVSTAEFSRARLFTIGASSLVSLAIAALYLVLVLVWRRNNELRLKAESDRELVQLGEAARTLVHEIKNPLAVIRIQSSTLRRISDSGRELGESELGKRLDIVDEEVERLSSLSDRIREFLKSGEGEAARVELAAFLKDFALRYAGEGEASAARKLLIRGELPAEAAALIDPSRLSQCLDNLVGNAFEASPPGAAVELSLSGRGRNWEISVADRGPGVEPGSEERLFEPFFTTKEKGSGIGLALARRIAETAGGGLVYRPRPDGGSIFTIALPKALSASPRSP